MQALERTLVRDQRPTMRICSSYSGSTAKQFSTKNSMAKEAEKTRRFQEWGMSQSCTQRGRRMAAVLTDGILSNRHTDKTTLVRWNTSSLFIFIPPFTDCDSNRPETLQPLRWGAAAINFHTEFIRLFSTHVINKQLNRTPKTTFSCCPAPLAHVQRSMKNMRRNDGV